MSMRAGIAPHQERSQWIMTLVSGVGLVSLACVIAGLLLLAVKVFSTLGAPADGRSYLDFGLLWTLGLGLLVAGLVLGVAACCFLVLPRPRSPSLVKDALDEVIQAMALRVEAKDRHVASHQRRVTDLAHAIAVELGLSSEQSRTVRTSGMLHDLGKMLIPSEILNKPGRLTEAEFDTIKAHPRAGYDILKDMQFPLPIADIVAQHHERMDGSGYPSGLKGDQTTLEARILAVTDVVEAMSSQQPYRPALGLDKALEEIVGNRGKLYDAGVVDACVAVFNKGSFRFADQTP